MRRGIVTAAALNAILLPPWVHAGPHKHLDLRTMSDMSDGQHTLSFCARPSPQGDIPGHAFVVFAHKPPKEQRKVLAVGFTTSSGVAQAALSYKGWLTKAGGYLGEERYTSINEQCLVVDVDKKVFDNAYALVNPFASVPGLQQLRWTAAYTLAQNDCMTFISDVARKVNPLKVPIRGETELPLPYLRRLIDAN